MIVNRKKLQNPYLKAYADIKGVRDGQEITVTEYMSWIDEKDANYRQLHGIPDKEELTTEQQKDFVDFLWLK